MDGRKIAAVTGLRPHEMYSLPKMMWIKKHRPEIYEQARHAFLMEDYVVFHLAGKAQIDYRPCALHRRLRVKHPRAHSRGNLIMADTHNLRLFRQPRPARDFRENGSR